MDEPKLSNVVAAAIEGRSRNLRGRQKELLSLFDYLVKHKDSFVDAVEAEESCSPAEAKLVVAQTLLDVRKHYDRLDLKEELDAEYSIARGKSCESRRTPAQIVYIIPDRFTLIFSVFSAVCAVIEAGSCCVVEVPNTVQKSGSLVRQAITEALDRASYVTITSRAPADFLARCLVIDQLQQLEGSVVTRGRVTSLSSVRTLTIVDRTGDVALAAREVVASRSAFGAKSSYAADQVFVNEFVAEQFIAAVIEELPKYRLQNTESKGANGTATRNQVSSSTQKETSRRLHDDFHDSKLIHDDGTTRVVEVTDRSAASLRTKITSRTIVIHRITSLDDAIDTASSEGSAFGALYLFAAPPEGKYLSQYISSRVTLVNHIPAQLLVGPAYPLGHAPQTDLRYTREMLEEPSPQVVPGQRFHPISKTLASRDSAVKVLSAMTKPLKPTGQGPAGAWDFFGVSVLLGATVYLLPVVIGSIAVLGYAGTLGYRKAMQLIF